MYLTNGFAAVFAVVAVLSYFIAFASAYGFIHYFPGAAKNLGQGVRHATIDGIRGYLAFGVYVHHCLATWLFLPQGHWSPLPSNFQNELGATSVALFFMITAFLFVGRVQTTKRLELRRFFITRLFRIYPLYLFVLFLVFIVVELDSHWMLRESPIALLKHIAEWLVFRQPDINRYYQTTLIIKGVTWTLLYEACFYLSLPLLVLIFFKQTSLWVKAGCLAVIALLLRVNHIEVSVAAMFLGGVFAVYWRLNTKRIDVANKLAASLIALGCLAAVLFLMYTPFNIGGLVLLTGFFAIIASGNSLFGLLSTRTALWMGEISYSIYLCHGLVLWFFMQQIVPHMPGYNHSIMWFAISAVGITPIVVSISSMTYLLIEKPLIILGHEVASRGLRSLLPQTDSVQLVRLNLREERANL